jgi:hypothetical protein
MIIVKIEEKGVIANMTEKFTAGDLDDLIYGECTLIPSDR